jgi:hypothetical protein
MHSPDSILSAGGKDWSSAPWVDWGDNPNTAGPARIAVGADAPKLTCAETPGCDPRTWGPGTDPIVGGPNAVLPRNIQISNEIRAFVINNKLLTAAILASVVAGAGYLAYSYIEGK